MRPWRSFGQRLQLSISLFLAAVVVSVAWAAHRHVQQVLIASTDVRLAATAREVSGMLAESAARLIREARDSAHHPAYIAMLRHPSAATLARAEELMTERQLRSSMVVALALVNRHGTTVIESGTSALPAELRTTTYRPGLGPLVTSDSGVLFRLVLPVVVARDTLGHVVQHRRLARDGGAKQITDIIGTHAILRVGNAGGRGWTDLTRAASAPPRDSSAFLVRAAEVRATPWVVSVHSDTKAALAPAREFLIQIVWIGLVLVVLGSLLAWALSVQTTAPLAELTRAAEDIARGHHDRRVQVSGPLELRSLATSFNSMAEKVGASAQELGRHAGELEAANAGLRDSEVRYRRLVEAANEGICTVDPTGRITYANMRLAEMLGYDEGALAGRVLFDLMDPEAAFEARTRFARPQRGIAESHELRLRRKDGATLFTYQSVSPLIDAHGEFTGALYMLADRTDQHALEAQLLHSQKLEAVGQLAGGIAHDFNNLLTVVTSYSGMLLADLPEGSEARADLQEIVDSAERAASLTRQLLAFSRQQVLQPRVLNLNSVVNNIRRLLGRVMREDIRIETDLAPMLGRVSADPGQIEQVIVNLAVNARDAMPNGGRLTIRTVDVELDDAYAQRTPGVTPGHYVRLAVTDTGTGMDAATRARVFEPFYTTKPAGHGTGLGLSTVYGIVRQSGGHVNVISEPGMGSTFEVYLPRTTAAHVPEQRRSEGGMALGSETVLLVEDDGSVRAVARRILERAGYTVIEAASGGEALKLFDARGAEIDVVLTDMVMPGMSGRELAVKLRERNPSLRALFMSGYTEDSVLLLGMADPGAAFIQKPFSARSLTERLREVLELNPA